MAGFGGKIGLEGESEYRKALQDITRSLKEVSAEMKVVSSSYDKNDKSIEAVAKQTEVLTKKQEEQQKKADLLKSKYEAMEKQYGKNSVANQELTKQIEKEKAELEKIKNTLGTGSAEYQKQAKVVQDLENKQQAYSNAVSKAKIEMTNAQAEVNKTTKELDNLGKELKEEDQELKNVGDGFTVFKGILADLGSSAIKSAVNGLKSLGSAIISVGKQAITSYADYEQLVGGVETLFKESAGVVENYANNAYKTAGLSANEYMNTVASFSASLISSLGGDTQKASEYANRAIIDMSDNANKMGTDMGMIQNAYQGFAKQNYTMLDNLKLGYGGTKTEMARLIKDASKLTDVQKELGITVDANDMSFGNIVNAISVVQKQMGIMGTTSKEASTTISGSVNSMKSAWSNLLTGIADDNADFGQLVDNFVNSLLTVADNLLPRIKTVIEGIGKLAMALIEDVLPQILQGIPSLLEGFGPTLMGAVNSLIEAALSAIQQLIPYIGQIIPQIAEMLISLLPQLLVVGIRLILSLAQGIGEAIPQLLQMLPDIITNIVEVLTDYLPDIINTGVELLIGLIDGIVKAIPDLIDMLPTIIDTIVTVLLDNLPMIVDSAIKIMMALIEGLTKAIPQLVQMVPNIIFNIVNTLISKLPEIIMTGIKIISSLIQGIGQMLGGVTQAIGKIGSAMISKLLEFPGKMAEVGLNLIKGLWNGINNAKDWILNKIKGFGQSILNGIKSFFGIHSPSTLFRDEIGQNLALGIGEGFSDEMGAVSKEMQDAIPTSFDTNATLNTNSSLGAGSDYSYNRMLEAFQEALSSMKIELDDEEAGRFVRRTVEDAIYT